MRYDAETGLYYLNSRYYDPEVGRFINADGYVSTGQGTLGTNMFAYCGNNPINRADPSGNGWITALIIVAVVTVAHVVATKIKAKKNYNENISNEKSTSKNKVVESQKAEDVKNLKFGAGNVEKTVVRPSLFTM